MPDLSIQTVLSLLSFTGGLLVLYLRLYIGHELDRLRKDIIETLGKQVVRQDVFNAQFTSIEQRVANLEKRR